MSEFVQVLVMMAAPAALMVALRRVNTRDDRAVVRGHRSLGTGTRPAQ